MSFAKAIAGTLAAQAAVVLAGLVYSIALARSLGPGGRGAYALLSIFHTVLATAGLCGLDQATAYFAARQALAPRRLAGHTIPIAAAAGALGVAAGAWVAWRAPALIPVRDPAAVALALAIVPFEAFTMVGLNLLLGSGQVGGYNAVNLARAGVPLALVVAAVTTAGLSVRASLAIDLSAWIAAGLLALALARRRAGGLDVVPDRAYVRGALRYGFSLYGALALNLVHVRAALYALGAVAGPVAAGYYAVAAGLAEKLTLVSDKVGVLLLPRVAGRAEWARGGTVATLRMLTAVLVAGAAAIAVLAEPLIVLLFGPAFRPAAPIARLLALAAAGYGVTTILYSYFCGIGRPGYQTAITAAGAAVNLALCAAWIPRAGAVGAAGAMAVSVAVALAASLLLFSKRTGVRALAALRPGREEWALVRSALMRAAPCWGGPHT